MTDTDLPIRHDDDEGLDHVAANYLRKARERQVAAMLKGRAMAAARRGQDRERDHRSPETVADLQARAAQRRASRAERLRGTLPAAVATE